MDKEIMVYVYNGILLIYKKEHICVSSNKVDEPIIKSEVSQRKTNMVY